MHHQQKKGVMKKAITLAVCLAACIQLCTAQNSVASIRQRYAAIKEYISTHTGTNENDGAEWAEYYHVEARLFLPATGGHKENIYMYFNEKEEDKIYPGHYLTFATTKYNYAAREFYEEYLYDEDGNVAFIYRYDPMWAPDEKAEDKEYEFRFYLNKGKLLSAIVKSKDYAQASFSDVYSGSSLKKEYEMPFSQGMAKAKSIHQLFVDTDSAVYQESE